MFIINILFFDDSLFLTIFELVSDYNPYDEMSAFFIRMYNRHGILTNKLNKKESKEYKKLTYGMIGFEAEMNENIVLVNRHSMIIKINAAKIKIKHCEPRI